MYFKKYTLMWDCTPTRDRFMNAKCCLINRDYCSMLKEVYWAELLTYKINCHIHNFIAAITHTEHLKWPSLHVHFSSSDKCVGAVYLPSRLVDMLVWVPSWHVENGNFMYDATSSVLALKFDQHRLVAIISSGIIVMIITIYNESSNKVGSLLP